MATAAGGLAGQSVAGPAGGLVGAAIGSYIDQQVINPLLFPPDPIRPPDLSGLSLSGASEGDPNNRIFGAKPGRPEGNVIWMGDFQERKREEDLGGKGGGPKQDIIYYVCDIAVEWGEGPSDGLGVSKVVRVWGDTGIVYDSESDIAFSNTDISASWDHDTYFFLGNDDEPPVTNERFCRLSAPVDGTDLSLIRSGEKIVVTGFTNSAYNVSAPDGRVLESGTNPSGTTYCVYRTDKNASLGSTPASEAAGNTITITQDNPTFDPDQMDSVSHYLGTEAQLVDSVIEAAEGSGNVPAFRGKIYSVFEAFNLEPYGNRPPGSWTAEISVNDLDDLQDVFDDILGFSVLESSEWDTSDLAGTQCRGYVARGPQPDSASLSLLMAAFDIVAQDDNGVLTFKRRSQVQTVVSVDAGDLGAHVFGASFEDPNEVRGIGERSGLAQVTISYTDDENWLQAGTDSYRRPGFVQATNKEEIDFKSITFQSDEANAIAQRTLWRSWTGLEDIKTVLPPSYFHLLEYDVIQYTVDGEPYRLLCERITQGAGGLLEVMGRKELEAHTTMTGVGEVSGGVRRNPGIFTPYDTALEIVDAAPLSVDDATSPAVYFAVTSTQPGFLFKGSFVYESFDDTNFVTISQTELPATMGYVVTSPPSANGGRCQWDRGSTIRVSLYGGYGQLVSREEIDVLNGANRVLVGKEIMGFATATLVSAGVYDISDLIRGLGGTEGAITNHVDGERFVHLNSPGLVRYPVPLSALGATRYYKAVAPGGDFDDYDSKETVIAMNTVKPIGPVHIAGTRDGSNDWTITWVRRSRVAFRVFSQSPPLYDDEGYQVEIYNGSTLVRTLTSATTSVTYTSAQQVTDFGSVQGSLDVVVYQDSDLVGRGRASETITISINT